MKKAIITIICFVLLLPAFTSAMANVENQDLDPNHYHAAWHSQSDYIALQPLEITTVWVKFLNTGEATWYNYGDHPVRLGTSHSQDRQSIFYKHTWLSENRAAKLQESEVKPGEYGTFEFYLKAPEQTGTYQEYFQPVIDGITWMEDWGVYWEIKVEGEYSQNNNDNLQYDEQEGYHAAWHSQSTEHITLNPGEYQSVWVKFLNTGSKTWYNYGDTPLHLGTDSPRDRNSGFYKHTWLASNRPAKLVESEVMPGQTGTFEFYVLAPEQSGQHYEYFTPVVENLTWIGEDGVYWIFEVTGDENNNDENNNYDGDFNLTGYVENGQVKLNWDTYYLTSQTSSNQISGYKIVRSEFDTNPSYPDDWWVYLSNQHNTSYTDTSVISGHSYYYRVGAYISGTGVIEYSNNIYLNVSESSSPDNNSEDFVLNATNRTNSIYLDWNQYSNTLTSSNSDIEGYKIVRSTTTSNPTYPQNYLTYVSGKTNTSYLDTSTEDNQAYYYRIGAYKNGEVIEYTNFVHIISSNENEDNNSDFQLTAISNNSGIQLSWDKYTNSNIDGYKIVRSISNSSPTYPNDYLKYVSGQTNTGYLDLTVDNGQDYYYRIGAYKNGDIISYTNPIHIEFTGIN